MSDEAPEGWEEVFRGPSLQADLIQAILEANGLRPVRQQLGPEGWWSGSVMEDCRIYVTANEAQAARQALADVQPDAESDAQPDAESDA